MRNGALRARILVAIGAGGLVATSLSACGGDDSAASSAGGAGGVTSTGAGGASGSSGGSSAGGSSAGMSGSGGTAAGSGGSGGSGGSTAAGGNGGVMPDGSAGGAPDASGDANPIDAPSKMDALITVRRPFLVGSSLRSATPRERHDWQLDLAPSALPDARTAEALAASWLRDALEEHASIAAFARFTMLLLSVGAPPDLIVLSQRASLDEVQHARACFALARRYGGRAVGPSTLAVSDSMGALSLADLAALTVEEGCVGETLGALLATEQLAHASDPEVVRLLRKIASDEARHAELAWRFLKWAVTTGGPPVAMAAERAFLRAIAEVERTIVREYGVDPEAWHAHGRLSCAEAKAVSRQGIRDVVLPAMRALLDVDGARPQAALA